MKKSMYFLFKRFFSSLYIRYSYLVTKIYFDINKINHKDFVSIGMPLLDIDENGTVEIGKGLVMVNDAKFSTLGKNNRCKFVVQSGAKLSIGDKVGMSNATIIATLSVKLGNNIMIGGGVTIADSDFHSLNPVDWHTDNDFANMQRAPVIINDNVFIGMNSIILKGVTVGANVVIAAASLVTKSIPDNEVWGGNPARFIKNRNSAD